MRAALAAMVMMLGASGCHAKFKKNVGNIQSVRPELTMPGGPSVNLGQTDGDGLLAAVVNVTQAVKSIDLTRKIGDTIDSSVVASAYTDEMDQALGKGPPFKIDAKSDVLLQMVMTGYGIQVGQLGAPGALTYSMTSRIYLPDGERVYTATHNCAVPFGNPNAVSVVFGAVNNSKAIKDMTDQELIDVFNGGARWCAQQTVLRVRRHAG